jgi:fructose-1,6-bisphosphatase/sedoheptulose 1,7-bisphosphatase-like protein
MEAKGHGQDHQAVAAAAHTLRSIRTGIILSGRVVNGKVELDQASLESIAQSFPKGDHAFVAVNAPFDPQAQVV